MGPCPEDAPSEGKEPEPEDFEGKAVELHSLKTTARNGLVGRAGKRQEASGRYPVTLPTGEAILVKPENLLVVTAAAGAEESDEPRKCKCPLCGSILMAKSEDECIAHMAQCKGFARVQKEAKGKEEFQVWPPPKVGPK
mmetsp:Transcript_53658/g.121007  ORF Transcript_53658/g.121007 Transcript_53658/m.121007 type:complete len:139 (-) Transcript_53658:52-468(-)